MAAGNVYTNKGGFSRSTPPTMLNGPAAPTTRAPLPRSSTDTNVITSTFNNSGTVTINSGGLNFQGGTFNNQGTFIKNSTDFGLMTSTFINSGTVACSAV